MGFPRLKTLFAAAALVLPGAAPVRAADGDITLAGSLALPNTIFVTDVWGFVDASTMREYAVLGDWDGRKIFIVDATDPADLRLVSEVGNVPAFDFKVWGDYLYTCDGTGFGIRSRVINISDPLAPVLLPDAFESAHNISISPTGTMHLELPGLRIFDLNADPANPAELAGFRKGKDGHDSTPKGNLLYDFGGSEGTFIWDLSVPSAPVKLDSILDPSIIYHHSGDATTDGTHLLICDELISAGSDVTIWNITGAPFKVADIVDPGATVHNLYVVGDLAYVSYYSAGFKVYDISNPASPVLADEFDTSSLVGEGFVGAFGVYPWAPNRRVYVSDIDNGLFVFEVENSALPSPRGTAAGQDTRRSFSLGQNSPNPFNPSTAIPFELLRGGKVRIDVFDARGRRIRTLVDTHLAAGGHVAEWDGTAESGGRVASGVYFYRLSGLDGSATRRMLLLK